MCSLTRVSGKLQLLNYSPGLKQFTRHFSSPVADVAIMLALMAGRNAKETCAVVNEGKARLFTRPHSRRIKLNYVIPLCSGRISLGLPSLFAALSLALRPFLLLQRRKPRM